MNSDNCRLLLKEAPSRLYLRYLLPSLCGCFFTSFYIITDTMMIGHGVGPDGLTALNIMLPMFSVFMSVGYMIGIGGSVCMAVARGEGNEDTADSIFTTSLCFLFTAALIFTVLCNVFLGAMVDLLGAEANNRALAMEYGRIMMLSTVLYFLAPFMQSFVKNDNDPNRVMIASITGNLLNIVLDYIFIFILHLGMTGAISATVIGFGTNSLICATHFFTGDNKLRFRTELIDPKVLKRVLFNGASAFLTEFSSAVVVFLFNLQVLRYLGDPGLVIYSVINNYVIVVISMINSAGYAAQPLISYNHGAGETGRVRSLTGTGLTAAVIISLMLYAAVLIRPELIISLFVENAAGYRETGSIALRIYFSGIIFEAISLYFGTCFQSVMQSGKAFVIGLLRGLLLPSALILLLPAFFGGNSIWLAAPLAELITAAVTGFLLKIR